MNELPSPNPGLTVERYTTISPHFVARHTLLSEILDVMEEEGIRHLPVIEYGSPIGIISDRDVKLMAHTKLADQLEAHQIMVPDPFMVTANTPLEKVALEMSKRKIGSAIVVNEDQDLVGIFTSTDALNALVDLLRNEIPNQESYGTQTAG